jgi:hypothetical protein
MSNTLTIPWLVTPEHVPSALTELEQKAQDFRVANFARNLGAIPCGEISSPFSSPELERIFNDTLEYRVQTSIDGDFHDLLLGTKGDAVADAPTVAHVFLRSVDIIDSANSDQEEVAALNRNDMSTRDQGEQDGGVTTPVRPPLSLPAIYLRPNNAYMQAGGGENKEAFHIVAPHASSPTLRASAAQVVQIMGEIENLWTQRSDLRHITSLSALRALFPEVPIKLVERMPDISDLHPIQQYGNHNALPQLAKLLSERLKDRAAIAKTSLGVFVLESEPGRVSRYTLYEKPKDKA